MAVLLRLLLDDPSIAKLVVFPGFLCDSRRRSKYSYYRVAVKFIRASGAKIHKCGISCGAFIYHVCDTMRDVLVGSEIVDVSMTSGFRPQGAKLFVIASD